MGYDMYLRGNPIALAEGQSKWDSPNYFRLNVFGMSRWTAAMDRLGMLAEGERGIGFPEIPKQYQEVSFEDMPKHLQEAIDRNLSAHGTCGPGIPWWKFSSNDGWIVTAEECREALEAFAEHTDGEVKQTLLETTDPGTDPVRNKARVTGDMVIAALVGAGANHVQSDDDPGIEPEHWAEWLNFLRAGAEHEGFEVF